MQLLIGILSADRFEERRNACRETWLDPRRKPEGIDAVFIVGDPTALRAQRNGDVLTVPYGDSYEGLSRKTAAWCDWALGLADSADVFFKCDDDTYVAVERLLRYVTEEEWGEYAGHVQLGFASGGAGYLLSRRAARIAADGLSLRLPSAMEDVQVAETLREQGILPRHSDRFQAHWNPELVPSPHNQQITSHYVTPSAMRQIHSHRQPES